MFEAATTGLFTGLSLILAIGAQNAFVLRQGLLRRHVLAVVLACALSDALLISVGVFASGQISQRMPALLPLMRWGGAAFLFVYGAKAAYAAYRGGEHLDPAQNGAAKNSQSLRSALLTCLAFTWLNPHVYLDTLVLLGAISARFGEARAGFALGASAASLLFFFALGYGARLLQPVFARETSWRVLDAFIALVMWKIALGLVLSG